MRESPSPRAESRSLWSRFRTFPRTTPFGRRFSTSGRDNERAATSPVTRAKSKPNAVPSASNGKSACSGSTDSRMRRGGREIDIVSELLDELFVKIEALCTSGDELAEMEQFASALTDYWAAWDLLPEPRTQWAAATWILA